MRSILKAYLVFCLTLSVSCDPLYQNLFDYPFNDETPQEEKSLSEIDSNVFQENSVGDSIILNSNGAFDLAPFADDYEDEIWSQLEDIEGSLINYEPLEPLASFPESEGLNYNFDYLMHWPELNEDGSFADEPTFGEDGNPPQIIHIADEMDNLPDYDFEDSGVFEPSVNNGGEEEVGKWNDALDKDPWLSVYYSDRDNEQEDWSQLSPFVKNEQAVASFIDDYDQPEREIIPFKDYQDDQIYEWQEIIPLNEAEQIAGLEEMNPFYDLFQQISEQEEAAKLLNPQDYVYWSSFYDLNDQPDGDENFKLVEDVKNENIIDRFFESGLDQIIDDTMNEKMSYENILAAEQNVFNGEKMNEDYADNPVQKISSKQRPFSDSIRIILYPTNNFETNMGKIDQADVKANEITPKRTPSSSQNMNAILMVEQYVVYAAPKAESAPDKFDNSEYKSFDIDADVDIYSRRRSYHSTMGLAGPLLMIGGIFVICLTIYMGIMLARRTSTKKVNLQFTPKPDYERLPNETV